jgi:hypothetical protein
MKKAILFLVVYVALFNVVGTGFHNLAFAKITMDPAVYDYAGGDVYVSCSVGDKYSISFNGSMNPYGGYCYPGENFTNIGGSGQGTYVIYECNSAILGSDCLNDSTPQLALDDKGYVSSINYFWGNTPPVVTPNDGSGISIFGGMTNGTGGSPLQASDMVANVESALQATGSGLFPIVAVVVGIFLTFLVANELKKMFKDIETKQGKHGITFKGVNSDNKKSLIVEKPLRQKKAIYNKDGRLAGYTFDD